MRVHMISASELVAPALPDSLLLSARSEFQAYFLQRADMEITHQLLLLWLFQPRIHVSYVLPREILPAA